MTVNSIDESWITFYEDRWVIEFEPNSESSESTWLNLVLTNTINNAQSSYTVNINVTAAGLDDPSNPEDEYGEEGSSDDWGFGND